MQLDCTIYSFEVHYYILANLNNKCHFCAISGNALLCGSKGVIDEIHPALEGVNDIGKVENY